MTPQLLQEQVAAARSGSREAFAALVGHYQGLVSATTLNIVGDFQQSEDIAQETFLIAWNQLTELREWEKFPAWLCGIARNCANNWLRRQKRNPLAKSTEISDVADVAVIETESSDEADAQLVWRSLADIPETYREPMLMFYRHGAKIAEIADALELTEEVVRQRLSRGRKLLKLEVERTVEKTLAATRPDMAFTLAVLAAIPLSASVGCSTTSKSISLWGGISAMSGLGTFGIVLSVLVCVVLAFIPTLVFAVVCFYAFWFAVKNSPTLRTRRFAVSAVLDMNVLFWLMTFRGLLTIPESLKTCNGGFSDLVYFYLQLPLSVQYFLSDHLPVLLVFSAFVVYIVFRWRHILHEDKIKEPVTERYSAQSLDDPEVAIRSTSGSLGEYAFVPGSLAHVFEREINFFRNVINGYRNSTLTARGLCVKRNVVIGIIAVFLIYHTTMLGRQHWQIIHVPHFPFGMFIWCIIGFFLTTLFHLSLQGIFFRFVSKAIGISQDETALEQTPPRISLAEWNIDELRPESRRQIFVDTFFLMIAVPLTFLLIMLSSGIVQERLFCNTMFATMGGRNSSPLIEMQVALVVLTVLWCSRNPEKRLAGFSALFLGNGLLTFGYIEYMPLLQLASQYYLSDFIDWLNNGSTIFQPGFLEMLKMHTSQHLTALVFLIYSLLASAFCYFLQPARASQR